MARDAAIAVMEGRVRVKLGVLFREPCSSLESSFVSRVVNLSANLQCCGLYKYDAGERLPTAR
eukprot:1556450-Rhodomonas_salina.1